MNNNLNENNNMPNADANASETGFLYCAFKNDTNERIKLVIDVVTKIDRNAYKKNKIIKSTASEKFYVDLNS